MTEERFKALQESNLNLDAPEVKRLTKKEYNEGYHYCDDWDFLLIKPGSGEWECCTCHPLRDKERKNEKENRED